MPKLDILYMTRVQRERFFNEADYIRLKDSYILTLDKLKNAKEDLCILHPLPRVNEIATSVDNDQPRMLLQTGTQRQIYPYGTDSEITGGGSVMHIDEIQNGIVIDHIKAGKGMELYHFLHLDELDCSVAILQQCKQPENGQERTSSKSTAC